MRKAITLGLLGLALIPLSLDRQSEAKIGTESIVVENETTQTATFAAERNAEIRRSLAAYETARDARNLETLNREIAASIELAKTRREAAFAAARNEESRRSMAAYEAARDVRFAEARNREIAEASARAARERTLSFAAERNAEARRSFAAYNGARRELMAEAYQREIALVAARYAEREIAIARANGESIFATLARIAPHIGATNVAAQRTMRTNPIETASIGEKTIIGPCATASP